MTGYHGNADSPVRNSPGVSLSSLSVALCLPEGARAAVLGKSDDFAGLPATDGRDWIHDVRPADRHQACLYRAGGMKYMLRMSKTMLKRDLRDVSLLDLLRRFAIHSSAHGIARVERNKSVIGRVLWSLVCVGALTAFCVQGATLLNRYYSYPKSVKLDIANKPIPFPSVSICNLRSIDLFTFGDILYDENMRFRWTIGHDTNYSARAGSKYKQFEDKIIKYANVYSAFYEYADHLSRAQGDPSILWEADRDLLSRLTLAANLNASAAFQGGVQKEEFIARCEFAGQRCSSSSFYWFLDPAYINCYTFNITNEKPSVYEEESTMYEGPAHGLSLVLFTPSVSLLNYTDQAEDGFALHQEMTMGGEGVRVVVHRADSVPYPQTEGMDVPRGVSASVGIRTNEYERLGPPWGNCTHRQTVPGLPDYTYTLSTCKKACVQELVYKSCGCIDASLPTPREGEYVFCSTFVKLPYECHRKQSILANFDLCSPLFEEWFRRMRCLRDARSSIAKNLSALSDCRCQARCKDVDYSVTYSLSDWPPEEQSVKTLTELLTVEKFYDNFPPKKRKQYFGQLETPNALMRNAKKFIKDKNLVRLNVYISDTSVIRVTETEDYTIAQLVSDIGGQAGFWVGISIITLLESVEFLLNIVEYCFFYCHRAGEQSSKSKTAGDEASPGRNRVSPVGGRPRAPRPADSVSTTQTDLSEAGLYRRDSLLSVVSVKDEAFSYATQYNPYAYIP